MENPGTQAGVFVILVMTCKRAGWGRLVTKHPAIAILKNNG